MDDLNGLYHVHDNSDDAGIRPSPGESGGKISCWVTIGPPSSGINSRGRTKGLHVKNAEGNGPTRQTKGKLGLASHTNTPCTGRIALRIAKSRKSTSVQRLPIPSLARNKW